MKKLKESVAAAIEAANKAHETRLILKEKIAHCISFEFDIIYFSTRKSLFIVNLKDMSLAELGGCMQIISVEGKLTEVDHAFLTEDLL